MTDEQFIAQFGMLDSHVAAADGWAQRKMRLFPNLSSISIEVGADFGLSFEVSLTWNRPQQKESVMSLSQKVKDALQKKSINWQNVEQIALEIAKDAPQIADAIISLIGLFTGGAVPTPSPTLQASASACPSPNPADGKQCCCCAEHHILLAAVACQCHCNQPTCDEAKCRAETLCHLCQALKCLACPCC